MKTLSLALSIIFLVGIGFCYHKFGFQWPFSGGIPSFKEQTISSFSAWKSILPGTWEYKKQYKTRLYGCIEEGQVEYRADSTFTRSSNIKEYQSNSPVGDILLSSYQWREGGGTVFGKWTVDTLKGAVYENVQNCYITRNWIKDGWKENIPICNTYYINFSQILGNFEGTEEKRWIKKFTNDSIVIEGKEYPSSMNISIWFKRVK